MGIRLAEKNQFLLPFPSLPFPSLSFPILPYLLPVTPAFPFVPPVVPFFLRHFAGTQVPPSTAASLQIACCASMFNDIISCNNTASMASAASPSLQLLEQKCLLREVVSRNGVQKNVHVVVKNAPFTVRVGLSRSCSSQLSLKQVTFDVALLYDVDQQGVKKKSGLFEA